MSDSFRSRPVDPSDGGVKCDQILSNEDINPAVVVSELKAKLSEYVAQVRGGATVTVCDRGTPIAKLVPFDDDPGRIDVREPIDPGGLPVAPGIVLRKPIEIVALLLVDREHR